MTDVVKQWYEAKENVEQMRQWERVTLKKWEQAVTGFFPAGACILDVGCGLGREAFLLSDMGFRVTGIDISGEAIAQVKQLSAQKGYCIPFAAYDGHTLPFDEDAFDVVVIWAQTFGLLYGNAYKHAFLTECKRVLKVGGLCSFSAHDHAFLTAHYPRCLDGRRFFPYANAGIYWEAFTPDELKRFAAQSGFAVMLCEKGEIYRPEDGTVLHCLCQK